MDMNSTHQEECSICYRENIHTYAFGVCDHPVCYQCSARMRVLCETNACPKCRSDMSFVVFTQQVLPFLSVSEKFILHDEKYQIKFENSSIKRSFDELLVNKCKKCEEVFSNFRKLADHTRRKHDLRYCELCTETLKLFSSERKCYTRKDLTQHERFGDPDEKSHIGHPLCEFCDIRYFDSDELFRHLRKDHFFCHFCDADGKRQFYNDYEYLRVHFRKDHYLCEEGDCINEKFTSAFNSKIDLKAHVAVAHSKNKSKAEVKKTRTLEFDFNYSHSSNGGSSPRAGRQGQHRRRNGDEINARSHEQSNEQQTEIEKINTESVQEFPYLSDVPQTSSMSAQKVPDKILKPLNRQSYNKNPPMFKKNCMTEEDFPVLCSTNSSVPSNPSQNITNCLNGNLGSNASKEQSVFGQTTKKSHLNSNNVSESTKKNAKWENSKKSKPSFEEQFPKLETKPINRKKNSLPPPTSVNAQASTVQVPKSAPSSSKSCITVDPVSGETFLQIKSKAKKEKHNKAPILESDTDSIYDIQSDIQNPYESDINYKKYLTEKTHVYYSEDDMWAQKFNLVNEDFPPLASHKPTTSKPPGFEHSKKCDPPPGFTLKAKSSAGNKKESISLSSIAKLIDSQKNSKEVNGRADSFDETSNYITEHKQENIYLHLPDDEERNALLIVKIGSSLNARSVKYNEFKTASGKFRYNDMSADDYYSKCLSIFGFKGFLEIFSELLVLLPDISKQQSLLRVHDNILGQKNMGPSATEARKERKLIVECELCNQILTVGDCDNHKLCHKQKT